MTADVDTQHLFFEAQQHLLIVFAHIRHPDIEFFLIFFPCNVKQGDLSGQIVLFIMGNMVRDLHIDTHELFSRTAQSVHGSCFDQVLNSPLIHLFFIGHAGNKVLQIRERASFLTLLYQAVNDGTSHTLDSCQGIADLAVCHRESGFSRIYIRRQNGDIHVPAVQNILRYFFRVIDDGSHQRRHEFYGIIVFQIRCLVSHYRITGRMGLVERIFGKIHHHIVDLPCCLLVNAVGNTAGDIFLRVAVDEVGPLFFHDGLFLLTHGTAHQIASSQCIARQITNDLHYLFLIYNTAVGGL